MSDESGSGLFGDLPAGGGASGGPAGYLVLARKYRPRTFEDLIGQEAMVRTIANSFALGRIPHAYILTGVRGVGKTTTARLLARALNYETDSVKAPSLTLEPLGVHCPAIMESRHPDIYEMDAASRTGINDIREILESVRYAPVSARMKVYIIDEVHMLSTAAFNGLLKTLEEPPPHVKFIFATTEIRKVPVTVLSRCQRFDLKRIDPETLRAHLAKICAKESVAVEADGLALIAKAAEGSVRDALSLLDQALVQKAGGAGAVTAAEIRDMLGLADRTRVLDLMDALLRADAKTALTEVRSQYDAGADPGLILRDLMEVAHEAARLQALGPEAKAPGAADAAARLRAIANATTPAQMSRIWQMLLKGLDEAARAPEPIAAAEMVMVRLAAAAGLPPPEEAARLLREGAAAAAAGSTAAPPPPQHPTYNRFEDIVALIGDKREIGLQVEVEQAVRLVRYAPGLIEYEAAPGAAADLPGRLSRALEQWTPLRWEVRALNEAPPVEPTLSLREAREKAKAEEMAALAAEPFVAEALKAFPGAALLGVREEAPKSEAQVVPLRRGATQKPSGKTQRKDQGS